MAKIIIKDECEEEYPMLMQTAFIFAARYTHDRNTGGTCAVCRALKHVWHRMSPESRKQIIKESNLAVCNKDDWQSFRDWVTLDNYYRNQKKHETENSDKSQKQPSP